MTGVVHENCDRLAVDTIYAQHGNCPIRGRGRNPRQVALKPAHAAILIHAKSIVANECGAVSSSNLHIGQVFAGCGDGICDLSQGRCFPFGWPVLVFIQDGWSGMCMSRGKHKVRDIVLRRFSQRLERTGSEGPTEVNTDQGQSLAASLKHENASIQWIERACCRGFPVAERSEER